MRFRLSKRAVTSAKELLPVHSTVTASLERLHGHLLQTVGERMVDVLQDVGGAVSIDYGHRKDDYLTVVVHFMHKW